MGAKLQFDRNLVEKINPDPGASGVIKPLVDGGVLPLVSAAAETRTLPDPEVPVGFRFTIAMNTDGGTVTITTASGINASGHTSLPFDDVGDWGELMCVRVSGAKKWRLIASNGITPA